jgi:hypothetical protein
MMLWGSISSNSWDAWDDSSTDNSQCGAEKDELGIKMY